ncbi:MAG: peptidase MA family metallohydrolase [Anaerolineae bacterium]
MPLHAAQPAPIAARLTHDYVFAQQITFVLDATSDARITRAIVFYQSDRSSLRQGEVAFTPETTVHVEVLQELRGGAIPPFSTVTYWWEIADEAGQTFTTPRVTFEYIDNRFDWRQVSDADVTVYWSEGDAAFGEAALDTAIESLPAIADEIGISPASDIEIYVYPSRDDLIGALRLGGRDWAGGQARPELGVVLVDVPASPVAVSEMRRLIPHELTHLLVYAATQPNYDRVPSWLDEGLATANEGSPDPSLAVALDAALRAGRLLSFESLCAPFAADAGEARLAYAQSSSLVQFIRDRHGSQGIRGLLAAYRENAVCAPGAERALNMPLTALESEWRAQLTSGSGSAAGVVVDTSAPWLALSAIACLTLLPILGGLPLIAHRKSPPQESM